MENEVNNSDGLKRDQMQAAEVRGEARPLDTPSVVDEPGDGSEPLAARPGAVTEGPELDARDEEEPEPTPPPEVTEPLPQLADDEGFARYAAGDIVLDADGVVLIEVGTEKCINLTLLDGVHEVSVFADAPGPHTLRIVDGEILGTNGSPLVMHSGYTLRRVSAKSVYRYRLLTTGRLL